MRVRLIYYMYWEENSFLPGFGLLLPVHIRITMTVEEEMIKEHGWYGR